MNDSRPAMRYHGGKWRTFSFLRYIVVPNVAWGMGLDYECDLLAMTDCGYLVEVEIKISAADIKRDAKKRKWGTYDKDSPVSRLYFAAPAALASVLIEHAPMYAGVITVQAGLTGFAVRTERKAQKRDVRSLNDEERLKLARLGTLRYWSRRSRGKGC